MAWGSWATLQSVDPGALNMLRKRVPDEGQHTSPSNISLRVSLSQPRRLSAPHLLPDANGQSAIPPLVGNGEEDLGL